MHSFFRTLLHLADNRAGASAVIFAISLSGIIGVAGLGTEAANWYYTKRAMQGAADAAASTAAAALAAGSTSSSVLASEAKSVAAGYKFVDGSNNTSVTVNYPPTSGNYQSSPAVEVIISQTETPLLSGLLISTGPTIKARAVALANTSESGAGCVVALNKGAVNGISAGGSSTQLNLPGCSIYDNASGSTALSFSGGATITAASAYIVGTVSGTGLTTTYGTNTGADPLIDPYLNAAVPSYSTSGCTHYNNQTTLSPSTAGGTMVICNGMTVTGSGQSLTLGAGTYIIAGGTFHIGGGSTLIATSGTTIILTTGSNGSCATAQVDGGATVNITAPTSGSLAGIALMQDRSCTAANDNNTLTGGSSQSIVGAIYFPGESINYSGGGSTSSQCTQLIANTINFSGSAVFNNNCTGTGTRSISFTGGRLVE